MSGLSTYRTLRLHRFDPDTLAHVLSQSKLEHYLLGAEVCDVVHEHWEDPQVLLDHALYSFKAWVRGEFGENRVCVGFIRDLLSPAWINGEEVKAGQIVVFGEHSELAYRAEKQTHWVAFQMDRSLLQEMAYELLGRELDLPETGMRRYQPTVEAMSAFQRVFDDFCTLVRLERGGVCCYKDMVVYALASALGSAVEGQSSAGSMRMAKAMHTVRTAEQFVLGHLHQTHFSRELAHQLRVSERHLESQFKKVFGMAPDRWKEFVGLNLARRRLAHTASRSLELADMAAELGFGHPDRFVARYGELFREPLPPFGG